MDIRRAFAALLHTHYPFAIPLTRRLPDAYEYLPIPHGHADQLRPASAGWLGGISPPGFHRTPPPSRRCPTRLTACRELLGCGDVPLPGQRLKRLVPRAVCCVRLGTVAIRTRRHFGTHLVSPVPVGWSIGCSPNTLGVETVTASFAAWERNSRATARLISSSAHLRCARASSRSEAFASGDDRASVGLSRSKTRFGAVSWGFAA
jgi:hypothetical protein